MRLLLALASTLVVISGCFGSGHCSVSQGNTGQAGVCNTKDGFSYGEQGGPISKSAHYDWQNSKGGALVSLGSQGTGSIKVTLHDAAGTAVFSRSFTGPGQFGASEHAQRGKAGAWKIDLDFSNVNGQIGLTVNAE